MTIEKAIKILYHAIRHTYYGNQRDLQDALRLGYEALKRVRQLRVIELNPEAHHLPSETKEEERRPSKWNKTLSTTSHGASLASAEPYICKPSPATGSACPAGQDTTLGTV